MTALLPFTPELLCEPLIVLRDSLQLSGGFMLPILTKLALQQAGHAVVLVAVAQGAAHYQQALRKVGVNMAAHVQSGQLVIVDTLTDVDILSEADLQADAPELLSRIVEAIRAAQQLPYAAAASAASGTAADSAAWPAAPSMNGLQATADAISSTAWSREEQRRPQPTVNVIIDDLTAIGSLIADRAAWRGLLEKLLAIMMAEQLLQSVSIGGGTLQADELRGYHPIDAPGSLIAFLHSDVEDAAVAEVLTSHAATVIVDIEPLTAGQSHDVSGRMRMQLQRCRTPVPWGSFEGDCQRQFFVKASDRGVHFLQQYTAA